MEVYETDPQADWYATESETCADIIDLYHRVWEFADLTIDELPLDALGRVPRPFKTLPVTIVARTAHWVEPRLVAEVRYSEWTGDGSLRHYGQHRLSAGGRRTQARQL